jgi:hypothetical protein
MASIGLKAGKNMEVDGFMVDGFQMRLSTDVDQQIVMW